MLLLDFRSYRPHLSMPLPEHSHRLCACKGPPFHQPLDRALAYRLVLRIQAHGCFIKQENLKSVYQEGVWLNK